MLHISVGIYSSKEKIAFAFQCIYTIALQWIYCLFTTLDRFHSSTEMPVQNKKIAQSL